MALDSTNGNARDVIIANAPNASGSYTLNSGTLTARTVFVAGDASSAGGPGALTLAGGTVNASLRLWTNGTVTLNGGTINAGSDPLPDNIENDGLIIINGGSLHVGGHIYGSGRILQSSGAASFAD